MAENKPIGGRPYSKSTANAAQLVKMIRNDGDRFRVKLLLLNVVTLRFPTVVNTNDQR